MCAVARGPGWVVILNSETSPGTLFTALRRPSPVARPSGPARSGLPRGCTTAPRIHVPASSRSSPVVRFRCSSFSVDPLCAPQSEQTTSQGWLSVPELPTPRRPGSHIPQAPGSWPWASTLMRALHTALSAHLQPSPGTRPTSHINCREHDQLSLPCLRYAAAIPPSGLFRCWLLAIALRTSRDRTVTPGLRSPGSRIGQVIYQHCVGLGTVSS